MFVWRVEDAIVAIIIGGCVIAAALYILGGFVIEVVGRFIGYELVKTDERPRLHWRKKK